MSPSVRNRGFTLVELLVVIGIIALLMALLTPAVMWSVNAGRRTRMGVEIAALHEAIEKYKGKVGDYPPNFRDYNSFISHVRTRYQKMAPANLNAMIALAYGPTYSTTAPPPAGTVPRIDEGESLVFWLALTSNDPVVPFNPAGTLQTYYEFDQRRLVDVDGDGFPSYRASYAKDTFYLYIDHRSYDDIAGAAVFTPGPPLASSGAFAELDTSTAAAIAAIQHDQVARPYANNTGTAFVNPTSFQILCAGQDGDFGNVDALTGTYVPAVKGFPGGMNYTSADRDNITNFSDGRTLEDHIP
jgi:prepilin-type N-terminal cleavage/methylation domain-containing protein